MEEKEPKQWSVMLHLLHLAVLIGLLCYHLQYPWYPSISTPTWFVLDLDRWSFTLALAEPHRISSTERFVPHFLFWHCTVLGWYAEEKHSQQPKTASVCLRASGCCFKTWLEKNANLSSKTICRAFLFHLASAPFCLMHHKLTPKKKNTSSLCYWPVFSSVFHFTIWASLMSSLLLFSRLLNLFCEPWITMFMLFDCITGLFSLQLL